MFAHKNGGLGKCRRDDPSLPTARRGQSDQLGRCLPFAVDHDDVGRGDTGHLERNQHCHGPGASPDWNTRDQPRLLWHLPPQLQFGRPRRSLLLASALLVLNMLLLSQLSVVSSSQSLSLKKTKLVRTVLQHRLRIPFLDQDSQCSLRGHVLVRFCDHAAVCPCAGDRNLKHNPRLLMKSTQPLKKQDFVFFEKKSRPTPIPSRELAMTDLQTSGFPLEKETTPAAWDFAVTSCFRPATQNPGPATSSTQNTFHDTANRCQWNGLRFTLLEAGETLLATWSPGSPTDSAPSDITPELAQRIFVAPS